MTGGEPVVRDAYIFISTMELDAKEIGWEKTRRSVLA